MLLRKVNKTNNCWLWQAGGTRRYGSFSVTPGCVMQAHPWAYIQFTGPIPAGLELDHLCRNGRCVNPAHLEAVTHAENVGRGGHIKRTARMVTSIAIATPILIHG